MTALNRRSPRKVLSGALPLSLVFTDPVFIFSPLSWNTDWFHTMINLYNCRASRTHYIIWHFRWQYNFMEQK